MNWMFFDFANQSLVIKCRTPSSYATSMASMIFTELPNLSKDRYGLNNAIEFSQAELDIRIKQIKNVVYDDRVFDVKSKASAMIERAKELEWIMKQGLHDHSVTCNHSDPESTGPCTCGYNDDNKIRESLFTRLVQ